MKIKKIPKSIRVSMSETLFIRMKKERITPTQIMKSHIGIHDRTTILHSLKTIQRYIDTNDILLTKYKDIICY